MTSGSAEAKSTSDRPIDQFRGRRLPLRAFPAGYTELIRRFDLRVPLHHEMAAIAPKNTRRREAGWAIYPVSMKPRDDVVSHLVFAMRYEALDLLTMKAALRAMDRRDLERAIESKPTSAYLRRLCFLYEWLLAERLDVPDTHGGRYVPLLDTQRQYGARRTRDERRFRIRFNLPGTPAFCPLVRRTATIDAFIERDFEGQAARIVASAPREVMARAAAFLLLSDSKSSFAIEGEQPSRDRIGRWARIIAQAGSLTLSAATFEQLQRDLIEDDRFVRVGVREAGGFVGRHDVFGQPIPEHISADPDDLVALLEGLTSFETVSRRLDFHPVLAAACLAFGFVYIHPFEDGNGRIHRFLLHHVMAERGYTPEGVTFPVSSAIYHDIARYKDVLESVSKPMLEWIEWTATDRGNVHVQSDTADYYRHFDATPHVEFLFRCIETVVQRDLPEELGFLQQRDAFHRRVNEIVDMPERTLDLLLKFLRQNDGRLSRRALSREFDALRPGEVEAIETMYRDHFASGSRQQGELFQS